MSERNIEMGVLTAQGIVELELNLDSERVALSDVVAALDNASHDPAETVPDLYDVIAALISASHDPAETVREADDVTAANEDKGVTR